MQVVIVTAWQRPAFLQACLDRLAVAMGDRAPHDMQVRICLDRGFTREVAGVASGWARQRPAHATVARRPGHGHKGNSFNVLTAYREALQTGPELVHLIEDDILVAHDYFDYHERAHALVPGAFSVSACRNQQFVAGHDPDPDPSAVFTHPAYQSLGVSFKPEQLRRVVPHASGIYYRDPVRYCRGLFPRSAINPSNAEQDGLLHRISEASGLVSVYPHLPRAYHAGFIGYHRSGIALVGSVREQADALLAMDADELNRRAKRYKDHTTIPLDGQRDPVSRVVAWP